MSFMDFEEILQCESKQATFVEELLEEAQAWHANWAGCILGELIGQVKGVSQVNGDHRFCVCLYLAN